MNRKENICLCKKIQALITFVSTISRSIVLSHDLITADFEKSARMKNNRGFECHLSSKYYFCLGNISTEICRYDQAFDTKISNSYQTTGFWKKKIVIHLNV